MMKEPEEPGRRRPVRNLVTRADGKLVNVARKQGQLFVCANGCCCGHTEHGYPPVPAELYHEEWERRRLRPHIHLSIGGCLGPCPLANVAMLLFDGRPLWFHSCNTPEQVRSLYDYIETLVEAQAYVPPPPELADRMFSAFRWSGDPSGQESTPVARDSVAVGGFVILTHADTDILAISKVVERLGPDFPPVRAYNIRHLRTEDDARAFVDAVVPRADVVILRLFGGSSSFRGGFERAIERAQQEDQWLICVPGTDVLDPELTAVSNVGAPVAHEAFAYFQTGGLKNVEHLLRFLSDHLLATGFGYDAPQPQPRHGAYRESGGGGQGPTLGLLFYRSHLLAGNTDFVDAIIRVGESRGARVIAVYTDSLRDGDAPSSKDGLPSALTYFVEGEEPRIDVLIATTSFAFGAGSADAAADPFSRLGVPVVQAIASSGRREQWAESLRGLGPVDAAMNVAIPELDGRIISVPVSFKEAVEGDGGFPSLRYAADEDRIQRVVGLALRLAALRRKTNDEKRIAFVLTDYNAKASRVGAAVGLDTPASLLAVLHAMQDMGYDVGDLPESPDALLHALIERGTYDREVTTPEQLAAAAARVDAARYAGWIEDVPVSGRDRMAAQWGEPPGDYYVAPNGDIALAGLTFGNAFVAIQPPRGYGMDPAAIYHMPDLPPPYPYHALYRWLATSEAGGGWGADAIVHVGKHGTLEWLPGKGVGLSTECFPDVLLADMPLIYPFIVNDPGEGAQAKRRGHAVIIDHLTPPMTTAEGYGEVEELSRLVDEYYQLEQLDPSKLPLLQRQIWELIQRANLDADLGQLLNRDAATHTHEWDPQTHEDGVPYTISDLGARDFAHLVENINGYLCELTTAQIRDGLHVLGRAPADEQLIDTLCALVRLPNLDVPSLRSGVASWFGLDLPAILDDLGARCHLEDPHKQALERAGRRRLATNADALLAVDAVSHALFAELSGRGFSPAGISQAMAAVIGSEAERLPADDALRRTLEFVCRELVPNIKRTTDEIGNLLQALDGQHVPAGPSGAPTRGMAQVLPTGRNFYTVDPRGLPSAAAWAVGQQLADDLIERHLAAEGHYPESVGISIWGTSLMRTHGDDVAEVMALIGVRPRWQAESRRLVGFDVMPLNELGRPRIDVVCRISGFFRDAFPDLIGLLDDAFRTVAEVDEPVESNAVRRHVLAERGKLEQEGVESERAAAVATYRIFGSPPGAYGAGILPLIDERNWQSDADFAEVYVNWGGYAYARDAYGVDAREQFRATLSMVEAAVKNQDNREHDIFDSDDYFQYHGGMVATIRALGGKPPRCYFGDSADPQRARVRSLKEEALRVFRTRVVNPKWIASIQRHGYKGALELASTVDYLFGYDATSDVVDDWMYERLAEQYALDTQMQAFFQQSNPWALRDVASRLLEAIDRGMWKEPTPGMRAGLERAYLIGEADVEARAARKAEDFLPKP
jgi:cobaltochelatase CobN